MKRWIVVVVMVLGLGYTALCGTSSRTWSGTLDIPGRGGEVTQSVEFAGFSSNTYVTDVTFWMHP